MKKTRLVFSFISLLIFTFTALAETVPELLASPQRPTILRLLESPEALKALPSQYAVSAKDSYLPNNGDRSLQFKFDFWMQTIQKGGPHFIASLEKAFPSATWAFVGRDSMALADIVEAFYSSLGQQDRVVRIGMSKQTFVNLSNRDMVKYLKNLGFDSGQLKYQHPFVLIDTVSSGYGRQGRALIDAIYLDHVEKGGNPYDLVTTFNMVGLIVSTFRGSPSPIEQSESTLTQMSKRYLTNVQYKQYSDQGILTYQSPTPLFAESGYEHYTGAWHQSFQPLGLNAHGHLMDQPGPALPEKFRLATLQFQKEIIRVVTSDGFKSAVFSQARQLGYEFPLIRKEAYNSLLSPLEILRHKLQQIKNEMKDADAKADIGGNEKLRQYIKNSLKKLRHLDQPPDDDSKKGFFSNIFRPKVEIKSNKSIFLEAYQLQGVSSVQVSYEILRLIANESLSDFFTSSELQDFILIALDEGRFSKKFYDRVNELYQQKPDLMPTIERQVIKASESSISSKAQDFLKKYIYFKTNSNLCPLVFF